MFTPRTKLRTAAFAATIAATAMTGLGAGSASAVDWPPVQEGAFLYSGADGTGTRTQVDLTDVGTCHTLPTQARSVQVVSGSTAVVLYSDANCTKGAWGTGTLAISNVPSWTGWSYRAAAA